jgi:hypothetical protein
MIDWLTFSIDASLLPDEAIQAMEQRQSKILKIDPGGEIVWSAPARESIRSDSHQLTVKLGSFLTIQGSPARVYNQQALQDVGFRRTLS